MRSILRIYALFLCLNALTCQVPGFGKCPDVAVKSGFNLRQYMGRWYEVERYFPIFFEIGTKCGQATYTLKDNNHVKVENRGYNRLSGEVTQIEGDAFAPNASEPAKLVVNFPSASAFAKGNYWVLDTDYQSYAVVYGCSNLPFGLLHGDIIWILGRQKTLPAATLSKVYKMLEDKGLRTKPLNKQDQSDCPFESEAEVNKVTYSKNSLLKKLTGKYDIL